MQIKRFVQFLTDGPAAGFRFSAQNGDGGADAFYPARSAAVGPKHPSAFSNRC
jgi:hypothetical protein